MILEVSSRVIEEDGRPIGVQGICRDVTARKQAELELRRLSELNRHQALHDDLTGLPNRACFGAAGRARDRRRPTQDGSQLAVLLMDLDRFKEINDTLGHRYGDLLLIELAPAPASRCCAAATRSRASAATSSASSCAGSRRADDATRARARAHPRRARAAVPGRRPAAARRGQHRGRALSRRTAATSTCCSSAPTSRCTSPRRRAPARRLHRRSSIDHDTREPDAALASCRARSASGELVLHYQPKLDIAHGRARRRRGAHALAAPDARPDRPGRVRSRRREDRADPAAHALRARRGARAGRALGERGPPASTSR